MNEAIAHKLIIAAALLVIAAVIFAGALMWTNSSRQQRMQAPAVPPSVASEEKSFSHYPAGNINGIVASVGSGSIMLTVPPLIGSTDSTSTVTVLIDQDTEIYKAGAFKDPAVYQQQVAAYLAQNASDPTKQVPPLDSYEHIDIPLSQLAVGTSVNVLPKVGSVQGTALHAFTVMVQVAEASTTAQ